MDFLRSAYSTQCRFFKDNTHESTIRWYRAASGAGVFPGEHHFGSLNWGSGGGDYATNPGEVAGAARPWNNGVLGGAFALGVQDGSATEFRDGARYGEPGLIRAPSGIPEGCLAVPEPPTNAFKYRFYLVDPAFPTVQHYGLPFGTTQKGFFGLAYIRVDVTTYNYYLDYPSAPGFLMLYFLTFPPVHASYVGSIDSVIPWVIKFTLTSGGSYPAILYGYLLPPDP